METYILNYFELEKFANWIRELNSNWIRELNSRIEFELNSRIEFANGTLSTMLNEFPDRFWKVSEASLGRDETQRQTCHELFHKYLSHLLKN